MWRFCSFESRRAEEMRSLIERHGGLATIAPSMKEIPLDDQQAVWEFVAALQARQIDLMIFMTGVGATALLEAIETRWPRDEFFAALNRSVIALRGPKPAAVLGKWKVRIDHRAPEPNTWHELLATLEAANAIAGQRIAIQEYGVPSEEFAAALRERGATVMSVPVYRWALPDDVQPLQSAISSTIRGEFDALLWTSAQQLRNVLAVAEQMGCQPAWLEAAKNSVIGSIGPTASETLREHGLPVHLEASPPKMGTLVKQLFELYASLSSEQP